MAYLDFLKSKLTHYDFRLPPKLVDGRDVRFRCRALTMSEYSELSAKHFVKLSDDNTAFGSSLIRAGSEIFRLTLEAIVEVTEGADGADVEVITPAAPYVYDEAGTVIGGELDYDSLDRTMIGSVIIDVAMEQLHGASNVGEGIGEPSEPTSEVKATRPENS